MGWEREDVGRRTASSLAEVTANELLSTRFKMPPQKRAKKRPETPFGAIHRLFIYRRSPSEVVCLHAGG